MTQTTEPPTRSPAQTTAETQLWEALRQHPGSTAKDLAARAAIGRSTAAKILRRWADTGHITRHPANDANPKSATPTTWTIPTTPAHPAAPPHGRLGRGELYQAVHDHITAPEHTGQPYTPGQIARALGRSAGAVTNALHRLAIHGVIVQTSERPRRYTHENTQQ